MLNNFCRLDLDACKSRVRKARSMLGQQSVSVVNIFLDFVSKYIYVLYAYMFCPSHCCN